VSELVLDCTGMLCPRPIIELAHHIEDVPVGGEVLVLADDVAAATDVPAWCRMRGQEYVGAEDREDAGGGVPGYRVRRLR
jgi:TusA-related sulfurtransferase